MKVRDILTGIGLLGLRVGFGSHMLFSHGLSKLTGFGNLADKFPDPIGLGSTLSLVAAIGAEVGCSILLILGLGTRFAAVPLAFTMAIALFVVHADDPWKVKEMAALYLTVYAVLVFTGSGRYSLDQFLWNKFKKKLQDS